MIVRTIEDIAVMLNAPCIQNKKGQSIQGVCIDSRKIEPNNLYIPIQGQRVDGHQLIDQIIEAGCLASIWQKDHMPYPEDVALILVDDTLKALQDLAKAYLRTLKGTVVGITGSNGKTSCKDMLFSICSQEKKTQKTLGNRNNEIGLPLTVLDLDEDVEIIILEMGMENKGEIAFLCSIAQPDISMISTIGSAHMENLGGKKQIAQAKLEILEHLKPGGLFVYDKESPEIDICLQEMEIDPSKHIVSFGNGGDCYLTSPIKIKDDHIEFSCSLLDHPVALKSLAQVQAHNALPCIYIAKELGISDQAIYNGLANLDMTGMRMQLYTVRQARILDDSYKSNPESAKAAIDTLMSLSAQKHIACLGDMLDLGKHEQELHDDIGDYAINKGVDLLLGYGPLSKGMVEHCPDDQAKWFETKEEMVDFVKPFLKEDCVILVKGSRSMAMDTVVEALKGESR